MGNGIYKFEFSGIDPTTKEKITEFRDVIIGETDEDSEINIKNIIIAHNKLKSRKIEIIDLTVSSNDYIVLPDNIEEKITNLAAAFVANEIMLNELNIRLPNIAQISMYNGKNELDNIIKTTVFTRDTKNVMTDYCIKYSFE
jgi:hypothetical protein